MIVQYVARLVYSNPNQSIQRRIALLPATWIFVGYAGGGLRRVDVLFIRYILLTIYVTEVNDIGKCVEMNLFIWSTYIQVTVL